MEAKIKWFSVDDSGQDRFFGVRGIQGADLPNNGDLVFLAHIKELKAQRQKK